MLASRKIIAWFAGKTWRKAGLIGLVIVGVTLGLGVGTLIFPMTFDHGNYAYAAWVWLEDGAVPYRDMAIWRPPMNLFVFALAEMVWGHSMVGIRLLDLVWQAATACAIAWIGYKTTKSYRAALFCGLTYALFYYVFASYLPIAAKHIAQPGGWILLPVTLSLGWVIDAAESERPRLAKIALAGALLALAVLFKYTEAIFVLPALCYLGLRGQTKSLLHLIWYSIGGLFVLASLVVWLLLSGAWPAFMDHHFNTLTQYVGTSNQGMDGLKTFLHRLYFIPMLTLVGLGITFGAITWLVDALRSLAKAGNGKVSITRPGPESAAKIMVIVWLVAASVSCLVQGRFFEHHYLPLFAPAAVLVGMSFAMVNYRSIANLLFVGLYFLALISSPIPEMMQKWWRVTAGQQTTAQYWEENQFWAYDYNQELVRWLKDETEPNDYVLTWGPPTLVNYLARRRVPTRFTYNVIFRFRWGDTELEQEFVDSLQTFEPRFVVIQPGPSRWWPESVRNSEDAFHQIEPLHRWLVENYTLVAGVGENQVYERNAN